MSFIIKLMKFTLLFAIIYIAKEARGVSSDPKTHVIIKNDMGDGTDIGVHCKSKNDDLGFQVVKAGESYEFSFHPNYFWGTLFFCGCSSNKGKVVWDAYKQYRDQFHCDYDCQWVASKDGIKGSSQGLEGYSYNWNPYVGVLN